ncbi:MAG: lysophospholipid acyltransferase family protein [Flavobacterium sp.]|nr:lysophospholipid acyltransferase family protein [Pedobacter sp.]
MNTSFNKLGILFLKLISRLPFFILYLLADLLFFILFYVVRYRRKVTQSNLTNAFPEKSIRERRLIEKKYYKFLADMIIESLKMNSVTSEEIMKRCKINNPELLRNHLNQGRSILMATGHYANWEWGNMIIPQVYSEKIVVIYKPLSNLLFGRHLNKMRSRFGSLMVPMKSTLRKIAELKNQLYIFFFTSDQTPSQHESQYFTDFLNQPTAVFLGLEKIAKKTNHPVMFLHINLLKRGFYEFTFSTIVEDPSKTKEFEITNFHTQKLEQIIRQRPELWLWSHKRWKFNPNLNP